ncbi:MAG TPA: hypothetical protein VIK25_01670 [Gemmatimonadaceae bacterium]
MAKHLLFLVHGVGDTKPDWSKPIQDLIRTLYANYHVAKLMPFDQYFAFREINYNDKFDARRTAWKTASTTVLAALGDGGMKPGAITKLTTWSKEPSRDDFINTHALDVVMYRFLSLEAEQVRTAVQTQILAALAAQPANDTVQWSVIAHSLGTSVTHDVLHQLFSPSRPAEWGALPAGLFKPNVVMMLANVSRLLENTDFFGPDGDAYRSAVRPGSKPSEGACDYFINVRHEWDPIPKPKLFRPADDWPSVATRAQGRYIDVTINAIEQPDVHDFAHYLRNPKTHVPLFRLLTVPALLSDDEAAAASQAYEESTPLEKFSKDAKRLEKLSLGESEQDWRNILTMLRDFLSRV